MSDNKLKALLEHMIEQSKEFGASSYEISGKLKGGYGFSIKVFTPEEWEKIQTAKGDNEDDDDEDEEED